MPKQLEFELVGARHHVTTSTILEISNLCPMNVKLVREPDNPTDKNAIRIDADGEPWDKMQIGYVPRLVAAELAPKMDKNQIEILAAELLELDAKGHGPMQIQWRRAARN